MTNKRSNKQRPLKLLERDSLTNLHNRFSLYDFLRKIVSSVQSKRVSFSVIMIDIDRFSHINQRIGQSQGDRVLQAIANRLKKLVKKEGYIARLGNDQFVIILEEKDRLTLTEFITKVEVLVKEPIGVGEKNIFLSASIGVSLYPEHSLDAEILIELARVAVLFSKDLGGDHFCIYAPHMYKPDKKDLDLEMDLYQALKKDQFQLYYQPIFSVENPQIVGVEALIRWQHPQLGMLSPSHFLPFCEITNLIIPIGEWVLREACQQINKWHQLGIPTLRLSINISARQLYSPGFLNFVTNLLEKNQFPSSYLEFEITETLIMKNIETVLPLLESLCRLGIRLSLDDFGTGYSSLSYLKKFPFSSLKIDQSFVGEMCHSITGSAIVDTIIALGKSLNMRVTAEGVETEEQLIWLQNKNCDLIQGYFYSHPLPAEKLLPLLIDLEFGQKT